MPRSGKVKIVSRFDPALLRENPDWVVLFGDNMRGVGNAGQACVRGEPNAYGIPTKKEPSMNESSFFTDEEFSNNCTVILEAFQQLPTDRLKVGELTLVLPEDGLGTGLAQLPTRAPQTYQFLEQLLAAYVGTIAGVAA